MVFCFLEHSIVSTPSNLSMIDHKFTSELRSIKFYWNETAPACTVLQYNLTASGCGRCPSRTTHNNATCSNISVSDHVCTFSVQTVMCGNLEGDNITLTVTVMVNNTDHTMKTGIHLRFATSITIARN